VASEAQLVDAERTPSGMTKTVLVHVLSARAELLLVLRAAMAVVAVVWMYVAVTAGPASRTVSARNLLPFQQMMADRPSADQRMFRELQEGLIEAESQRDETGTWPSPSALAEQGVPPFAVDPTRRIEYDWTLSRSGIFLNYLGIPRTSGAPAWLLLVQEPVPGVPPDQNFEDEEHHRLRDGAMLHVSTWVHGDGEKIPLHIDRMPQAEGWTQLYAVGPSARPSAPTLVNSRTGS
jgi:hypothetical protein